MRDSTPTDKLAGNTLNLPMYHVPHTGCLLVVVFFIRKECEEIRMYFYVIDSSQLHHNFRLVRNQWEDSSVGLDEPGTRRTPVVDLIAPAEPLAVKSVHELVASFGGTDHPQGMRGGDFKIRV
jgi:hypothetical protein